MHVAHSVSLGHSAGLGDAENRQLASEGLARQLSCQEARPQGWDTRPPRPGRPGPTPPRPIGPGRRLRWEGGSWSGFRSPRPVSLALDALPRARLPFAGWGALNPQEARLEAKAWEPRSLSGEGAIAAGGNPAVSHGGRLGRGAGRGNTPQPPPAGNSSSQFNFTAVKLFPPALSRTQRANSWLTRSV